MGTCPNHPGVAATGRCAGCAEEFCSNCLVDVQGQHYCAACKVMALQGRTPTAVVAAQERAQLPNPDAKTALTMAILGIFCFGIILEPWAIVKAVKSTRPSPPTRGWEEAGKRWRP